MNRIIARRRKGGFTLIELLVVVLILAILMAVALPLYLSAVADSETKTCRSNMQTVANATQAYRVKYRLTNYAPIETDETLLNADLQFTPTCPTGGTYSVDDGTPTGAFTVACTNGAHGSFVPGQGQ
jgi:type IV pilus assembly protein PilA